MLILVLAPLTDKEIEISALASGCSCFGTAALTRGLRSARSHRARPPAAGPDARHGRRARRARLVRTPLLSSADVETDDVRFCSLIAFAEVSRIYDWTRPVMTEDPVCKILKCAAISSVMFRTDR